MILQLLLTAHVISGIALVIGAFVPLIYRKASKMFFSSLIAVASTGVLMMFAGTSIVSVCVRFVVITFIATLIFSLSNKMSARHTS